MNEKKIELNRLTREEVNHELESLLSIQPDLTQTSDDLTRTDATEKLGRYGSTSFINKFVNNPAGNTHSHMRTHAMIKNLATLADNQITELRNEKIRLDRILGPQ